MITPFFRSPDRAFTLLHGDCFELLPQFEFKFDMIFADPPYALKELGEIPDIILDGGMLNENGIFIFEHGKDYDFSEHPRFFRHISYGSVNFSFFH